MINIVVMGESMVEFSPLRNNNYHQSFAGEDIEHSLVNGIPGKQPGAYLISTCPQGERSFSYGRDTSAAKSMLSAMTAPQQQALLSQTDLFYFSGISLAILLPEERLLFWQLAQQLVEQGIQLVFDSNYRPVLWESKSLAKAEFQRACEISDVVFAGAIESPNR